LLKNFSDNLFEVGLVEKMSAEKEATDYQTIQLDKYASYDWRDKLVIKREGAEYFMEHTTEQRSRINYGILLHRVLAHISYKQQAEASLQQLHVQNVITDDECKVLTEKVSQLIDHPVIGNWFSKEWEVLTEVPVLVPGGRQSRMDRVLLGKKKTVVIDYKTGEKREQDRKQVESYAGLLSEMKYPNVEAYLLYLDPLEVVEVVKGSTLQLEF